MHNLSILKVSPAEPGAKVQSSWLLCHSFQPSLSGKQSPCCDSVKEPPSPPPLLLMCEFIYSQRAPTCKTVSHSAFTATSCVIFPAAKQAPDGKKKKDLRGDKELRPPSSQNICPDMTWRGRHVSSVVLLRRGFGTLAGADFGEQQQSLSSKASQSKHE